MSARSLTPETYADGAAYRIKPSGYVHRWTDHRYGGFVRRACDAAALDLFELLSDLTDEYPPMCKRCTKCFPPTEEDS